MTKLSPRTSFSPLQEVRCIVTASSSSFAAGMRLLPRRRREAIFAIYALCRIVDDIADGPAPTREKLSALDEWSGEIERVFQGTPRTAIGEELSQAVGRYQLPRREFDLILEGMRMDAEGMVAPNPKRLARYVRCVAGTVGVVSMHVFGAWQGDRSQHFALTLGRALQLTNILRDIEEDAGRGRLYLPTTVLAAAGVPLDPHIAWAHPALPQARRQLGLVARAQFCQAWAAQRSHPRVRILPALAIMGPYERLLADMEADWALPPSDRSSWGKVAAGLRCAAQGLFCQ